MSLTSLEDQIEEEVKRRVRLKLRAAWKTLADSIFDHLKLLWEEICKDGDVLQDEGQSTSDPASPQLDGNNTETDDSTGSDDSERDTEETQTNDMTLPNDTNVEEDDDYSTTANESDDNDRWTSDFDTLRTNSPNRTEEDGVIAEDEYPASGRISDLLNHVPLATEVEEVEEEGNHEDEGEVEYQMRGTVENGNIDNLEAEGPFVEPPSPPQAAKSKRKVADSPCPYCSKMFVEAKGVKIHISKSRYCKDQRMQRRSGFMGDDDGPSAASTPINQGINRK